MALFALLASVLSLQLSGPRPVLGPRDAPRVIATIGYSGPGYSAPMTLTVTAHGGTIRPQHGTRCDPRDGGGWSCSALQLHHGSTEPLSFLVTGLHAGTPLVVDAHVGSAHASLTRTVRAAAPLPILASHDWWPVFSPDSKHVAFTNVNGQGRVFTLQVANAASGDVTTLANASSQLDPSWAPDAQSIAYQSGGRIWTIGIDGTGRREVHAGLYPAWSPDGQAIAYVLGGVLHAGAAAYGTNVIGVPAWSPDGRQIAYAQSDGIYVGTKKVASPVQEARTAVWSPDGKTLAYVSGGGVYVVPADGASAPLRVAGPFKSVSPLAWSNTSDELSYTADGRLVATNADGGWHTLKPAKGAQGASYAPGSPHSDVLAYSGPNTFCAGHDAILLYGDRMLAGSCAIDGTAGADVIDGTPAGGDRIHGGAGNDTIRARNGHHDTVDCGSGRDTVYADKGDTLVHCEIVHR